MPLAANSGPCIRNGCDGRIVFEYRVRGFGVDENDVEVTRCPVCELRHERDVKSGFVSARWDDDEPPEFAEGYYLA